MNRYNSLHQFVKDGLIGLVVAFIAFVVLLGILLGFKGVSNTNELWGFIVGLFVFPKWLSIANGIGNWHVFLVQCHLLY